MKVIHAEKEEEEELCTLFSLIEQWNTRIVLGIYWISPAFTFWSTFSLYKYVQGNFNLPESAPDHQVFKIKTDESEYRTQGTSLRQG